MPAAIKEQIIFDAALKVVTERGYNGATTKQIAEEAGIGEVTLFRRFGTKDRLILEAVKRETARLGGEVSHYTGDLENDLIRIATAYQGLIEARGLFMLTYLNEVIRYPELGSVLQFPLARFQTIVELMQRYQAEGRLKAADPVQQVTALFGPIIMLALLEKVGFNKGKSSIKELVQNFLEGQEVRIAAEF